MRICEVKNCNKKHLARGYCVKHYKHIKRHGKILERTIYTPNEIVEHNDYCEVVIYNKQCEEIDRTLIDKEALEKVRKYKWWQGTGDYIFTNINNKKYPLHQFILGKKKGFEIDHINRNKLDNRKQNLRHCTKSQNLRNTKSKGFSWHKPSKKWVAYITINHKHIHLGYFAGKQKAMQIRKEAEKKYFGEFAYNYNL